MQEVTVKTFASDSASNLETPQNRVSSKLEHDNTVADNTYRHLLGDEEWAKVKPEIQQRFSVKPALDKQIVYVGTMLVKYSFFGWLFAQFCRLIGRPLATHAGEDVPVIDAFTQ